MALGDVTNTIQSGGGTVGAGAAVQARTLLALGVSPGGTVNALYNIASTAAIRSTFDPGGGGGVGPLGEYAAKILDHYPGGNVYCVPLNPSAAGGVSSSVTQVGTGSGAITASVGPHVAIKVLCSTSGNLGTARFRFSLDGGTTYSDPVTSSAGGGTDDWTYRVPGTFCVLTFAYGSPTAYTATKTLTVAIDGTVTNGAAWTGTVTQASSPVDNYAVRIDVVKGGALGTAAVAISLDNGLTPLPNVTIPAGGTLTIPGTGLVLTCSSTFTAGDYYTFNAAPAGFSTSDVTAALAAVVALSNAPNVALVHCIGLPSSASGAFSLSASLSTSCATARSTYGRQWFHVSECPSAAAGDVVVSGGYAVVDSSDTDSAIRTARASATSLNYGSVFVATQEQTSSLTGFKLRRPTGWGLAARYVENDPNVDPSLKGSGPLDFYLPDGVLHRDEWSSGTSLYDVQLNVLRTYPGTSGAFLAIESGGYGWRNLNTDANFQDADGVRVLMFFLAAVTTAGQKYLGSRQGTNPDGTIAEGARQTITADLDSVAKKSVGLLKGGQFVEPQASAASATVLSSSQLGESPHRMDVQYVLQKLGFVSAVSNRVLFSGTIAIQ